MSREIKFRAWHKKAKEYRIIEKLDFDKANRVDCITTLDHSTWHDPWDDVIEEVELEQYTGLKDKNGKEIYEGDIVKAKIDGFWQTGVHTISEGKATWNLEVVYNEIRYMDVFHILGSKNAPDKIYYLFEDKLSDLEVIGNIHENGELLNGNAV